MTPNTHDEVFGELGAFALGALDPLESASVDLHVRACSVCTAELAELREVVGQLPNVRSLAKLSPSQNERIRTRLVTRADEASPVESPTGTVRFWRVASLAAAVAFIVTGYGYTGERSKRADLERDHTARVLETQKLTALIDDRNSQIAAITGPSVAVMEMSATGINAPRARMFWDRATNRWTVFAHGLARPKPGRAYELWLVTADKKIPAGVFKPADDGTAVFTATYALKPEDLKAIAVTEEPEAGVPQPTGAMILIGTAPGT